jgi:hypothetical protein
MRHYEPYRRKYKKIKLRRQYEMQGYKGKERDHLKPSCRSGHGENAAGVHWVGCWTGQKNKYVYSALDGDRITPALTATVTLLAALS